MRIRMHASDLRVHVYAYTSMCMYARVLETMKGTFFYIKVGFGMNLTSSESYFKPLFSEYIKSYMVPFQNTQKILRENIRFTKNSESKKESFKKHPQVKIFLIKAFSSCRCPASKKMEWWKTATIVVGPWRLCLRGLLEAFLEWCCSRGALGALFLGGGS